MLPPVLVLKMNLSRNPGSGSEKRPVSSLGLGKRPIVGPGLGLRKKSESSSGSECDNSVKSWFWAGEEGRHKPRARKGANVSARHRAKQETSIDFISGSMDVVKKEPWFWLGEKANNLAKPKSKKEVRARAVVKEEAKIKARARAKQEARPEEEFLTGAWFLDAQDSSPTPVGRATVKSGSQVEDDSIVGSWFWTEEETSGTFRPQTEQEPIGSSVLGTGENTSVETEADATSKSVPTDEKKRSLPVFAGLMKKPTQRQKKRPFLDLGFGSVMRPLWKLGLGPTVGPGQSLRKKRSLAPGFGLEKKSVQWLSSEKRPGQELKRRQYLGLGFGLETMPTWILGQKSAVILCQGLRRRRSPL